MNQIARRLPAEMTADEFLDWPGDGSGRRFELVDGRLRPVSPASPTHGSLQANLVFLVKTSIKAAGLRLRTLTESAVVPGLNPSTNVRVPDVIVTPEPDREQDKTVPQPVLLIEVLSPGNLKNTRESLAAYATIPSVAEIVAVHSSRMRIEIYRRDSMGSWAAVPEIIEPQGTIRLASVMLGVMIEEVYEGTRFVTGSPAAGSSPSPSSAGRP